MVGVVMVTPGMAVQLAAATVAGALVVGAVAAAVAAAAEGVMKAAAAARMRMGKIGPPRGWMENRAIFNVGKIGHLRSFKKERQHMWFGWFYLLSRCAALLPLLPGGPARHCVPRPSAAWHSLPDTMQQPSLLTARPCE